MASLISFLFILTVPIAIVASVLVGLFAVGALFDALENPDNLKQRLDGLFHQPPREPRPLSAGHYYQPYWR